MEKGRRLMDKRKSNLVEAHEEVIKFTEVVVTPEHIERSESELFRDNKHVLVKKMDLPCFRCGSKDEREVHHIIEWSKWNVVDPKKDGTCAVNVRPLWAFRENARTAYSVSRRYKKLPSALPRLP